jgi:hypothetical protein
MSVIRPNLICVGATKAGTTWLFQNLSGRSDVWSSPIKEINMITPIYDASAVGWTQRYLTKQLEMLEVRGGAEFLGVSQVEYQNYISEILVHPRCDASWYDLVYRFKKPGQVSIDISPSYAAQPLEAIQYLSKSCSEARFVYIIREPFARAMSHLRMLISRKRQPPETYEEWMSLASDPNLWDGGNYYLQIPLWKEVLGDRIIFLPFGQIISDPNGFLKSVEKFCELDSSKYPKAHSKVHETRKIEIPIQIRNYQRSLAQVDQEFILSEFGADFFANT